MLMVPQLLVPMMPFAPASADPALDRNLGGAYNAAMDLLRDDQWAVFLDHDATWTTRHWYDQILEAIAFKPDAGVFSAVANRIGCKFQKAGDPDNHDMRHHRQFGEERRRRHRTLLDVTDIRGVGGVVIVISKAAWHEAGGFADGMLCVDHKMHFAVRDVGRRVYLMEHVYCYHWRRAFGDELAKDTPRAADCPCRGPEPEPTIRISLP